MTSRSKDFLPHRHSLVTHVAEYIELKVRSGEWVAHMNVEWMDRYLRSGGT